MVGLMDLCWDKHLQVQCWDKGLLDRYSDMHPVIDHIAGLPVHTGWPHHSLAAEDMQTIAESFDCLQGWSEMHQSDLEQNVISREVLTRMAAPRIRPP